jgi:hypothetical protein
MGLTKELVVAMRKGKVPTQTQRLSEMASEARINV